MWFKPNVGVWYTYIMIVTDTHEVATGHTPEQRQLIEISDSLQSFNYSLFGHGTPFDDPASFFESGMLVSPGFRLIETALKLDPDNIEIIDDWPHKKYSAQPSVVLLAIPNPDPEQGIPMEAINRYVFEPDNTAEKTRYHLPAKYVVGFYQSGTRSIELNPNFNLTDASYGEDIAEIDARQREVRTRPLYIAPTIEEPTPDRLTSDSTDQVW